MPVNRRNLPAVPSLPLPYRSDSCTWFQALRALPCPVFLDSGPAGPNRGRFDILCAAPRCRVLSINGNTWRQNPDGSRELLQGTPFQALQGVLEAEGFTPPLAEDNASTVPFNGGALGYFGYDLGRRPMALPATAKADIGLPDMNLGIYPWAVVVDHHRRHCELVGQVDEKALEAVAEQLLAASSLPGAGFRLSTKFTSNLDREAYQERFQRVKDYILAGDCYQVNLAQRFSATYEGDTWTAYQRLRTAAPTPFSAYLELPEGAVLSLSPERFLQSDGQRVESKPIKGTRPRGASPHDDARLRDALLSSVKDRAENLMIVDLLRNDLGKTCRTGSVRVPSLFAVESYANVHHLVSTVEGQLQRARDALPLLEGAFPGGSITGAPKRRAMEIIEELEPHRRNVYCGSIGYLGFSGRMDTSICIRTLVAEGNRLHCWAGGGLVADSDCETEYQETLTKVGNLLHCLEQA
ncbi:aminodeoxychorismate synthase component I [Motiliproteus sp. SC1-56]|uniref:aminodeoxychorismate synthase component I n=1 Tax=Motiliproteus sp. SC1-56 TaxID=2799565 RepID=UPI001F5D1AF1|nr:aminodeoxychorismate synthase component I [Motiliproteus sp. SC1-56]